LYQIYSVQRFISIMPGKEGGKAKPLKKPKKEKHYDDEDLEHLKKKKVRLMYISSNDLNTVDSSMVVWIYSG